TYRVFNDTADEAAHIACGLEMVQTGRYTIEAQHPPLGRVLLAVPAWLAGLRYSPHWPLWTGSSPEFYWRTLSMARLGNLVWAPLLLVCVFLWARDLYGRAAGWGAAVLVSFCPNLLAHASLATLDFGAATTVFAAAWCFWRWSRTPSLGYCVLSAAAFAIAALTKFSALVFLPLIAAAFFLIGRWNTRWWRPSLRWLTALGRGALFTAVAGLLIWSGYLFHMGRLGPPQFQPAPGSFAQNFEHWLEKLGAHRDLPAAQFVAGLRDVAGHNAEGHPSYLLGRISLFGWWYYFPVVLALKTTLPLLLLAGVSLAASVAGGTGGTARASLCPLAAIVVLLGVSMTSHIDLGVRHVLAIYPFLALLASQLCSRLAGPARPGGRRTLAVIVVLLGGWHVGESLVAAPDYLAYFNETVRGREDEFLLDSNLDWGQDLERLRVFLTERGITTVHLSFFGRGKPILERIPGLRPLGPNDRPSGWVAVSKSNIPGLGLGPHNLAWLRAYTPAARVGKSILVYYFPER
ncbi:MAG TPA: glycosyltransferase family 39 protein, partial [Bryobacterales bacterium]|nr:glycosyltransferase family 39 protein [Bryobacterales bacterium]